jgi:hypothetical protein
MIKTEMNKKGKVFEQPKSEIKIFEAFKPETIELENKEAFSKYASQHADDIAGLSTYKLNKAFYIKGYRITKRKGEIGLETNRYIPMNKTNDKTGLKLLDEKINYIIEVLKDNGLIGEEEEK